MINKKSECETEFSRCEKSEAKKHNFFQNLLSFDGGVDVKEIPIFFFI